MPEYVIYNIEVSTLTPLHIGSGVELLNEYDYKIYNGYTWRIDQSKLLEAQDIQDVQQAMLIAKRPPAELINPVQDCKPESPFFRYVIKGVPRSTGTGAVLQEQIKDIFDRPYLPGSSLKGALRSSFGAILWKQRNLQLDLNEAGRSAKWAAQKYEKSIFGRDPNHDIFRALQVSDSLPVESDRLMVANARVITRTGKNGTPIELEAIRQDTTFHLTIKCDLALLSDWAKRAELKFPAENAFLMLPRLVNASTLELIRLEKAWFDKIPNCKRVAEFYSQLLNSQVLDNQMLLRIGRATGWESKTFGSQLFPNPALREATLRQYRMARGKRNFGDPFPQSRQVAVSIQNSSNNTVIETPLKPFGWVLIQFSTEQTSDIWRQRK